MKKTFSVRIDEELLEGLDSFAREQHRSRNWAVVHLLTDGLFGEELPLPAPAKAQMGEKVIPAFLKPSAELLGHPALKEKQAANKPCSECGGINSMHQRNCGRNS